MVEKYTSTSLNIDANVGCLGGLDYQDNGTQRIKGSFPHLVTASAQIFDQLSTELPSLVKEHGDRVSRLSSRYFVTQEGLSGLDQLLQGQQIGDMDIQLEAALPLGKIFQEGEVKDDIYWVWVGGNRPLRKTDPKILDPLKLRFKNSLIHTYPYTCSPPEGYRILLLGTPNRLQALKDEEIPPGITPEVIFPYAEQIAQLYAERLKVYVADNGNPKYIANVVGDSSDTDVFAMINPQGEVEAITANEFTRYPIQLPNGENKEITICEANDAARKRGAHKQSLSAVVTTSMINAVRNAQGIETECVPEAFTMAGQAGFKPMGVLERTSYMVTDGANIEIQDKTIPEKYRKFNSLFLYWMNPSDSAWKYWKNYGEAA